jgi:hypothetical protein
MRSSTVKEISSWFSPKVYIAKSTIEGEGLFAKDRISKDELIAVKAGHIVPGKVFYALPEACKHAGLQVADDLFVVPIDEEEVPRVMNYINHTCDPNVGLRGHLETVAMRDIEPGEELTGDYCIAYSNQFFQFTCNCGAAGCRKQITSDDWKNPVLQKKYKGYFSQYLQMKINQLNQV